MSNYLNIAIVGAGNIGERHAKVLENVDKLKLFGIYDNNPVASLKLGSQYGIKVYDNYSDLLNDENVQVVSICTPPGYHKDLVLEAVNCGKNVIVEKPFVLNAADAEELMLISEEKNIKIGVIAQHRFSKNANQLKEILVKENIIPNIESVFLTVKRSRNKNYMDKDRSNWRNNKNISGGGVLISIAIHYLDLLCWWFDCEFEVINCKSNLEKWQMESKIEAELNMGAIPIKIYAECGPVNNQDDCIKIKLHNGETIEFCGDKLIGSGISETHDRFSLHTLQYIDFAEAILNNSIPFVTPKETIKTLKLIEDIYNFIYNEG